MQRPLQFRPVGVAAALHLGETPDQVSPALRGIGLDRLPLGFEPETTRTLARCADPLVPDDPHASPPPSARAAGATRTA
jgi:hypothetical protein